MSGEEKQEASPSEPPDQPKGEQHGPTGDGQPDGEQQEMKTSPFPEQNMERIDLSDDYARPADDD